MTTKSISLPLSPGARLCRAFVLRNAPNNSLCLAAQSLPMNSHQLDFIFLSVSGTHTQTCPELLSTIAIAAEGYCAVGLLEEGENLFALRKKDHSPVDEPEPV